MTSTEPRHWLDHLLGWGTVGLALGTFVLAFVGLRSAGTANDTLALQVAQDQRQQAAGERSEPNAVVGWLDFADGSPGTQVDPDNQRITGTVFNASGVPMYEVIVRFAAQPTGQLAEERSCFTVLEPGGRRPVSYAWLGGAPGLAPTIEVTFRDPSGLVWRRQRDGTLTKLSAETPHEAYGDMPLPLHCSG